jgi:hypothetical protein
MARACRVQAARVRSGISRLQFGAANAADASSARGLPQTIHEEMSGPPANGRIRLDGCAARPLVGDVNAQRIS